MATQTYQVGTGLLSAQQFEELQKRSLQDPEGFWGEIGQRIDWIKKFSKVKNTQFSARDTYIRWYEDGTLNASYNCIDRHLLRGKGSQTALIWEGNSPQQDQKISYQLLHDEVCRLANGLKQLGVNRGDRVTVYLPVIPQTVFAMLACARIGAVHSVIFGGFSSEAIATRIDDCQSQWIITADESLRGEKVIEFKSQINEALKKCKQVVKKVVVVRWKDNKKTPFDETRDVWYDELVKNQVPHYVPEAMGAEDPLFILYTSGSTGRPKGLLHTIGGYLVHVSLTHEIVFSYRPGDVYWCTADCAWITGHSYALYGPLSNGATTIIYEGLPNYPNSSRFWDIIDKHQVNIFYTAPTALRQLMREGDALVKRTSRKSLRVLGSVGEPINPEVWLWYYNVVGEGRCAIVDTWWQTETGAALIAPLPGLPMKPGSAMRPLFGVKAEIVNAKGEVLTGAADGALVLADSWPGQARTIYGDHKRFIQTYFAQCEGKYFTGDGARRDVDGHFWITGRIDDVLIVNGHNLGTAEIENALVAHQVVAEAAVVAYPHAIKGNGVYAYVTLKVGVKPSPELERELIAQVRKVIGPLAQPDHIHFAAGLPKTRSGKIMRRILRKIAENSFADIGDTTTLIDQSVVQELIAGRKNLQPAKL